MDAGLHGMLFSLCMPVACILLGGAYSSHYTFDGVCSKLRMYNGG